MDAYLSGLEAARDGGLDLTGSSRWRRSSSPGSTPRWTSGSTRSAPTRLRRCAARRPSPTRVLAYAAYEEVIASDRWKQLAAAGANPQRPLWASTGVKNPDYPDTLYVTDLVVADTVNTMPEKTLDAFADHGEVKGDMVSGRGRRRRRRCSTSSRASGIDLDDVLRGARGARASTSSRSPGTSWSRPSRSRWSRRPSDRRRRSTPRRPRRGAGSASSPTGSSPDLRAWFAEDPERASAAHLHRGGPARRPVQGAGHRRRAGRAARAGRAGRASTGRRDAMFRGEHINVTEDRAVLHTALRLPEDAAPVTTERGRPGRRRRTCTTCCAGSTTSPTGSAPAPGPASPASGSARWSTSASAAPTSGR